MTDVVGLGAGGHAKVVLDILRLESRWNVVGLLDPNPELRGASVDGVEVLGGDSLLSDLLGRGIHHAFVGVGSAGDLRPRQGLYELARSAGLVVVDAIHPSAVVASSARIGPGVTLAARAIVNPGAVLGENVLVNTGAIVEHDCTIGDHAHIATSAALGGGVEVGDGSHVGIGASVRQEIRIGRGSIVGAGAVVIDDVPDGVIVAGVPASLLRIMDRT